MDNDPGPQNANEIARLLDNLHNHLSQGATDTSANSARDALMRVDQLLETIQLAILMMQTQNMGPRFRFMSGLSIVTLGLVRCGLRVWIEYGHDMPRLTSVLCVLVLFLFLLRIGRW